MSLFEFVSFQSLPTIIISYHPLLVTTSLTITIINLSFWICLTRCVPQFVFAPCCLSSWKTCAGEEMPVHCGGALSEARRGLTGQKWPTWIVQDAWIVEKQRIPKLVTINSPVNCLACWIVWKYALMLVEPKPSVLWYSESASQPFFTDIFDRWYGGLLPDRGRSANLLHLLNTNNLVYALGKKLQYMCYFMSCIGSMWVTSRLWMKSLSLLKTTNTASFSMGAALRLRLGLLLDWNRCGNTMMRRGLFFWLSCAVEIPDPGTKPEYGVPG